MATNRRRQADNHDRSRAAAPARQLKRMPALKPAKRERRQTNRALLRRIAPALRRAARGDFSKDINFPDRPDEFHDLYVGFQLAIEAMRSRVADETGRAAELKDTLRQFQAVIQGSADGIMVMNEAGQIELINPALEDLTGWTESEIRGQSTRAVLQPRGEDGGEFDFVWLRNLTKRRKHHPPVRNATIRTKTGTMRWVGITAGPEVRDERGAHTVVILRDIGESQELLRRQREFVSITSHELRTPITAMLGYLALLKAELPPRNPGLTRLVDRAYEATARMSELVEDLLSVARLEEGRLRIRLSTVRPGATVEEVAQEFGPTIKRKRIDFRITDTTTPAVRIRVDRSKFSQIVRNLIDNALKYTPSRGRVTVSVRATADRVSIIVRDTGIGIHSDNLKRVYDKFFREYSELGVAAGGTGLGLFITRELVGHLGGRLNLSSRQAAKGRPGGTVARVSFPRVRQR